ncbi:MAG: hypothetical protein IH623_11385 [Verrucomicrobia bacterium]|nr:hypothetical protein [Verrucomicrobiota bacterium]
MKKRHAHPSLPGLAEPVEVSLKPVKGREEPTVWLRAIAIHSDWPTESGTLLREIKLHRGLNVLWAEPAPTGTKNRLSGHATGKTTFCRLVRYVLNDADAGTKDFRQRFQAKFPRGWVFGEVVVAGQVWLVGRPLGRMGYHPFAVKGGTLPDAKGAQPMRGGYEDYCQALADKVFADVTLRNLSGTNRALTWDCLLEWLARDQEARFTGLLEWRHEDSDYESPTLLDADKENLVRVILGLVEGDEQKLLREHAQKSSEHRRLLEDRPSRTYHAERQRDVLKALSGQEVAKPDDPLLLEGIKKQARGWRKETTDARAALKAEKEEHQWQELFAKAEAQLMLVQGSLTEADRDLQKLQGTLASTKQTVAKVDQHDDLRELMPFKGRCSQPLNEAWKSKCPLAAQRPADDEFDKFILNAKNDAERTEAFVKRQRQECSRLATLVRKKEKERDDARTGLWRFREAMEKKLTKADEPRLRAEALEAALKIYQVACDECESLEKNLKKLDRDKRKLDQQLKDKERQHIERISRFSRIYDFFAKKLLGDDVAATIEFTGKAIEPAITYHGPYDSTALKLAKFLAFDLSSLALGIVGGGHHPRFLLHDSPREADLTRAIYHELFRAAVALEGPSEGDAPFQYIITTTEPPPDDVKTKPWLLDPVLNATEGTGRLFGVDL